MEIVQQIWEKFHRLAELVLEELERGVDYASFQERLKEELNELARWILKEVLEAADGYLRQHREERPGWEVERKEEAKGMLTSFGEVRYKRTYYRHKETGEYAHLVDRLAGYEPHARVDANLKAEVVDLATELSYRKSGKEPARRASGAEVSGTAVMQAVREFDLKEEQPVSFGEKRRIKYLFVEADEDHVPAQGKGVHQPKLVYVHEGGQQVAKDRRQLKSPYYLAGIYPDAEDLWYEVLDYLDRRYDLDYVEHIFVAGDGAPWIRKGVDVLPKSVFVLDRFHLEKYLVAALGRDKEALEQIWQALKEGDELKVQALLKEKEKQAISPSRKRAIAECRRYIRRNWDGIMAWRLYPEVELKVSAEGHVSHILAARLSSRPRAWSLVGADRMARLLAAKANGVNLRERYLAQKKKELKPLKVEKAALVQQRQKLKEISREVLDNLPVLRGPVTELRRILKQISRNISLL